jgi:hypothetical protein
LEQERRTQDSAGRAATVKARDHGGSVNNSPAERRRAPQDLLVTDVVATRTSPTPSRDPRGTRNKQGTSSWFLKRMEKMTSRASNSPGAASESLVRTASIAKSPGLLGATKKRTAAALQGSQQHLQALAGSKKKVAQTLLPRPSPKGVDDLNKIACSVASASENEGLLLTYSFIQQCV